MRRYGRIAALWSAFYSRDLYRDVAHRWKGIGVGYLWLLLALCWLPWAIAASVSVHEDTSEGISRVVAQLPTVRVEGGEMTCEPAGRHVIELVGRSDENPPGVLIIDDSIDEVPSDISTFAIVVTRREIGFVRPTRGDRRMWALSSSADMELTPERVDSMLRTLLAWAVPVAYLGLVVGTVVFRLLQALLYGGVAIGYARARGVRLDYACAVRLAAVALTPVIVGRTLLSSTGWTPVGHGHWLLGLLVTLGYIVFAVRAVAGTPDASERLVLEKRT